MNIDRFGQIIYNENDLCEIFLKNQSQTLKKVLVDCDITNPNILDLENFPELVEYQQSNLSTEEFDALQQSKWHMPNSYKEMDIARFILEQCATDAELQRAGEELLLFQERDMFDLLKYLKYLVDTMRENNIVWGVGRGSSVSSFVLYLIGIHKINSLYYDLSIDEFLK